MSEDITLIPFISGTPVQLHCISCGWPTSPDHVCQTGDRWKEATLREINAKLDRVLAALDAADGAR